MLIDTRTSTFLLSQKAVIPDRSHTRGILPVSGADDLDASRPATVRKTTLLTEVHGMDAAYWDLVQQQRPNVGWMIGPPLNTFKKNHTVEAKYLEEALHNAMNPLAMNTPTTWTRR